MADQNLDEAVLAIQDAADRIMSVSTQMDGFDGKQNELLASFKVLTERVANMEHATQQAPGPRKKYSVPPYDRVGFLYKHCGPLTIFPRGWEGGQI